MHVKHNMRRRVLVAGAVGTATIVALSGCAGGGVRKADRAMALAAGG